MLPHAVAVFALLPLAAEAAAPPRIALRHRAGTVAEYVRREDRKESLRAADGVAETHVVRSLRETRQTLEEGAPGEVIARLEAGRERHATDGVTPPAAGARDFREIAAYRLSGTGEPTGDTPGDAPLMRLPIRPVRIGDTWSEDLPPTPDRPFPLAVLHTLLAVTDAGGERLAAIGTQASTRAETPEGPVEVRLQGTTDFDLARGLLLRSRSTLSMRVRYPGDPASGRPPIRFDREVVTRVRRTRVQDVLPAAD